MIATPLLDILALPVVRAGAELRSVDGAWAVIVTEVCDGHGLIAAWLALTVALTRSWAGALRMAVAGILAIQLFNLFRIVLLAVTVAASPSAFETVHLFVFPLLTVGGFALLALWIPGLPTRRVMLALGLGTVFAVPWLFVAAPVSGTLLVPGANLLLWLFDPYAIETITPRGDGWVVSTLRLASLDPPAFLVAPIHPEDFAIALPALLAAAFALRGGVGALGLAAFLMITGLALGALTAGWSLASAIATEQIVEIAGDGSITVLPYVAPSETWQGLVRLAQNGAVHFNLLVLPILVLARGTAQ